MENNTTAKSPDSMKFWNGMSSLKARMDADPELMEQFMQNPQGVMRQNGIDCPVITHEGNAPVSFTSLLDSDSSEVRRSVAEQLLEQASMAPGTQAYAATAAVALGAVELIAAVDMAILLNTYVLIEEKTLTLGPERPKPLLPPNYTPPVTVSGGNPTPPEPEDEGDDPDIPDEVPEEDPDLAGGSSSSRTFDDYGGSGSSTDYHGGTIPAGVGGNSNGDDPGRGGSDTPGYHNTDKDELGGSRNSNGDGPNRGGDTPGYHNTDKDELGGSRNSNGDDPNRGGVDSTGARGGSVLPEGGSAVGSAVGSGSPESSLIQGSRDWGSMTGPGNLPGGSKDWESMTDPGNLPGGSQNWESMTDPSVMENPGSKDQRGSEPPAATEPPAFTEPKPETPIPAEEVKPPRQGRGRGLLGVLLAVAITAGSYVGGGAFYHHKANAVELNLPAGVAMDIGETVALDYSVEPEDTVLSFSAGGGNISVSGNAVTGISGGDSAVLVKAETPAFFRPAIRLFGETVSQSVPAHVHDYTEKRQEPTCMEAGKVVSVCACGKEKVEDLPALGHDYVDTVTEPSCTEGGFITHCCSRCGDSVTEATAEALGHSYEESVRTEAGCVNSGSVTYTCSRCADSKTETTAEALGHAYAESARTDPGCVSSGSVTYTCSRCGESYSETLTPVGHSYRVSHISAQDHQMTCSRCGDQYVQGHSFGDGAHCSVCGKAIEIY